MGLPVEDLFNPDASKQAQEIVFSRKANTSSQETVYFNNVPVIRENIQKLLGLLLYFKLSFFDHINETIKKATKGVNAIRKMNLLFSRSSLLTIYKSLVRPHLEYDDKIESVQYNAALAMTGTVRGT